MPLVIWGQARRKQSASKTVLLHSDLRLTSLHLNKKQERADLLVTFLSYPFSTTVEIK